VSVAAENYVIFGGLCHGRRKLTYFLRPTPGRRKLAVIFGGHPSAAENNSGRRKSCTVLLCPVFPPFHLALHSSHTYTLASLSFHSTRLDLTYFRGRARASVFGTCAMGEPLIFGPNARPNSHAARRQCASVPFSLRSAMPFTQDIHITFGVFPHAWT
jgi:hypothetical protein